MAAAVPLVAPEAADRLAPRGQVIQEVREAVRAQAVRLPVGRQEVMDPAARAHRAVRAALAVHPVAHRAAQAQDRRMDRAVIQVRRTRAAVAADRAALAAVPATGLGLATIGSQYQYRIHAIHHQRADHRQYAFALPTNRVRQVRMSAKLFTPVALKE